MGCSVTSTASSGVRQISSRRVLLAERAVLGHVAAGLAHEPHGSRVDGLAAAGAEEAIVHRGIIAQAGRSRSRVLGSSTDPMGDHIAITGANGFVGRHLTLFASSLGWDVLGLVRSEPAARVVEAAGGRFALVNPADTESMARALAGARAVVHLAQIGSERNGVTYDDVNVAGTRRVIEAAHRSGVPRIVFFSGLGVVRYGQSPRCTNRYFLSKLAAEVELFRSDREVAVFRPSYVVGPGDTFVPTLLGEMAAGEVERPGRRLLPDAAHRGHGRGGPGPGRDRDADPPRSARPGPRGPGASELRPLRRPAGARGPRPRDARGLPGAGDPDRGRRRGGRRGRLSRNVRGRARLPSLRRGGRPRPARGSPGAVSDPARRGPRRDVRGSGLELWIRGTPQGSAEQLERPASSRGSLEIRAEDGGRRRTGTAASRTP